jgi:hypothetical protein
MAREHENQLAKRQVLALRGLRLPALTLKSVRESGIRCEPSISIAWQKGKDAYVIRGRESGGAAGQIGVYCGFVGEAGESLEWLDCVDTVGRNGFHAVVIAEVLVRVQVFRTDEICDLLITRHALIPSPTGKRPLLQNTIIFHGVRGKLPARGGDHFQSDSERLPVFHSSGGELITIPPNFTKAVHGALQAAQCNGCHHTHLLRDRIPSSSDQSSASTIEQVMHDPAASVWLKNALKTSLDRDPVDAANEAEILARLLDARAQALLKESN